MNCKECGNKLGANTIHKGWKICRKCRDEKVYECIDCGKEVKKEGGRCLSCGVKHGHHDCSGENNSFYGKRHTEEAKKRMGAALLDYNGSRNPFYGKHHTEESKKKIGGAVVDYSGTANPMYNKSIKSVWIEKYGEIEAEKRWNSWYDSITTATSSVEFRNKMRENGIKTSSLPGRKTNIEKKVEQYLIDNNIEYTYSFPIRDENKAFQYDFLLKRTNILIEVQGDYWHGNPKKYNEEELNEIQIFKKKRDIEKRHFAEKHMYHVKYIWESDINRDDFSSIQKSIKFAKAKLG